MTQDVVIVGFKRTPFHFAKKGELTQNRPDDMAALVIKAVLEQTGASKDDIEDIIMGCAFPEGEQGFNIGRIAGQIAKLPHRVAGVTVNRFCGSSMQAIHMAAGSLAWQAGRAFLCGGVESMSRIPMGGFNPMPNPGLYKSYPEAYISMGKTAENLARKYNISRQAQDKFAYESQMKAAKAQKEGRFDEEIVPVGDIKRDGTIRPDTTLEALAGLEPSFSETGTVTAGTSSPLTDGAVATLICTLEYAKEKGLSPLAKIRSMAVSGCEAEIMGIGPVRSSQKALERAGVSLADIDIIELNEAFSAQSLAVIEEMGLDTGKLNLDGGAIALGHPLGASGARITGKAAQLLKREGKELALATMCIGGGQGIATVLEAV